MYVCVHVAASVRARAYECVKFAVCWGLSWLITSKLFMTIVFVRERDIVCAVLSLSICAARCIHAGGVWCCVLM